ncbi:cation:proton antiporter subunit C [Halarchaeum sp. P4]|uniref:cation:proton antiporter subunit C n=1 Tax=Halarchaeum sp. P4 TaxID=3421639 RepID=UPI003EBC7292
MVDVLGPFAGRLGYVVAAVLVAVGLFVVVDDDHLVKKVVGLNVFQTGVLLVFLLVGYRTGGGFPLGGPGPAVNPLPQALVLTAIVVGVSLSALALALVVRVYAAYGTVSESELREVLADE